MFINKNTDISFCICTFIFSWLSRSYYTLGTSKILNIVPSNYIAYIIILLFFSLFFLCCVQGRLLLGDKGVMLDTQDIVASNGIIHLINGVFVPPSIVPILPHRCDVKEHKITVVCWVLILLFSLAVFFSSLMFT